ncbi:MAG TPA: MauE/DoxX family redox-associated membrane protein [Phycisphaerae bacterium]|nr:MauE/DoxX family redox-associated membrane protein [Phycisphaerae bacterium]
MTASLESPPSVRRSTSYRPWEFLVLVSALLALASILKLWAFATTPSSTMQWTNKPLVVLGGSAFEILLASWLASGWQRRTANLIAVGFFLIVVCIAASKWSSGELSCGCFGPLKVSPWITTFLDLGILAGLLWQLFRKGQRHARASTARIVGALVVGGSAAMAMPAIAYHFHPAAASGEAVTDASGLIVLEPEKWVGKPFPLATKIVTQKTITQGVCRIVLFHSDCPDCQRLMPQIEQTARTKGVRTVLVEIPPVAPPGQSIVPPATVCEIGTLDSSKEWFATTPVIIDLADGQVVRQQSGGQAQP